MRKQLTLLQQSLNLWALILIVWSVYRAKFVQSEWFDELIVKPAIFVLPVYFFIKKQEHENFFSSILLTKKKILSEVLIGLFFALLFLSSAFLINYIKFSSFIERSNFVTTSLVYFGIISFATAISEEILSRGFILRKILIEYKNPYIASLYATALFLIIHVPILFTNLKLKGINLIIYIISLSILSFINSLLYLDRKNLTLPILIHGFYNLSTYLYIS